VKVKKVAPSSGPFDKRNLLLAAVAWVAGRIGSDSGSTAGRPAKAGPGGARSSAGDRKAADRLAKKKAAADRAQRKARAKRMAMPPKIVAKQSRKAAKLTKKSRAGK